MNCRDIQEQLVETARGRELSSDLRAIVFSHVAGCEECTAALGNQRRLTRALGELALHTDGAPARMEQMIRRQLAVVPIRKGPVFAKPAVWGAMSAIAAGLLLTAFLLKPHHPVAPTEVVVNKSAKPETLAVVQFDEGGFIPLPYVDEISPNEQTEMVRVEIPRESLAAMGVLVNSNRDGEEIQADILVGTDGTARAIRLAD